MPVPVKQQTNLQPIVAKVKESNLKEQPSNELIVPVIRNDPAIRKDPPVVIQNTNQVSQNQMLPEISTNLSFDEDFIQEKEHLPITPVIAKPKIPVMQTNPEHIKVEKKEPVVLPNAVAKKGILKNRDDAPRVSEYSTSLPIVVKPPVIRKPERPKTAVQIIRETPKETIEDYVQQVSAKAEQAVMLDSKNEHFQALYAYQEAIFAIENTLTISQDVENVENPEYLAEFTRVTYLAQDYGKSLSLVEKKKMLESRDSYLTRVEQILLMFNQSENVWYRCGLPKSLEMAPYSPATSADLGSRALSIVDYRTLPAPETLPESVELTQYFLLMKSISYSIQRGAYIGQNLFVKKDIWFQTGVKISHIELKRNCFSQMIPYLLRLEQTSLDRLDVIMPLLQSLQEVTLVQESNLLKKLKINTAGNSLESFPSNVSFEDSKSKTGSFWKVIGKSVDKLFNAKNSERSDEYVNYVSNIAVVFQKALRLYELQVKTEAQLQQTQDVNYQRLLNDLLMRLRAVALFLHNIVCSFVLRDLEVLLDKYTKRLRNELLEEYSN